MRRLLPILAALVVAGSGWLAATPRPATQPAAPAAGPRVTVRLAPGVSTGPLDGRLLLLVSTDASAEPRFQIDDGPTTQQVFGIDVDGWRPGETQPFDAAVLGYPRASLREVPPGTYRVQALLHRYETFRRADGHTVKLPMDRGEGQQWNRAPGNLYSTPRKIADRPAGADAIDDRARPGDPADRRSADDTKYIKHERIQSELLTKFWGRPMYLGAHVLLPEGFDAHPNARYPLVINHGHFPPRSAASARRRPIRT